jgi:hypothetical protein
MENVIIINGVQYCFLKNHMIGNIGYDMVQVAVYPYWVSAVQLSTYAVIAVWKVNYKKTKQKKDEKIFNKFFEDYRDNYYSVYDSFQY